MSNSYVPEQSEVEHAWHVVDAEGQTLGKLATRIAVILQGKHKPTYTPFIDTGDHVIVINADRVMLTGKKQTDKVYHRYTGYFGGLKEESVPDLMVKHPTSVVELAVKRMLPKTKLGKKMFKKLRVYSSRANYDGQKHPHVAQQPQPLSIRTK